jgi:hypothetical protein
VEWTGLPALERDLQNLPKDLADQAVPILGTWGTKTAIAIAMAYPRRTGTLAARVYSSIERGGAYGPRAKVVSGAPHASLYEKGTVPRYLRGSARLSGKPGPAVRTNMGGTYRGAMPPAPAGRAFIPRMQQARRELAPVLADLMRSFGLTVTGSDNG